MIIIYSKGLKFAILPYPKRQLYNRSLQALVSRIVACTETAANLSPLAMANFANFKPFEYIPENNLLSILEENIILDYLNNDVPYLSIQNGILYYGKPENQIILGRQRGVT